MKNERKWVKKGTPYPLCQLTNFLVLSNFTFVPSLFEQTHSTEKFIQHSLCQRFKLLIEAFLENANQLSVSR